MKIDLEAFDFESVKKGDVKRLRKSGKIPGILYGHKDKPKKLCVAEKEMLRALDILKKEVVTVDLKVADKHYPCLIKAVQYNPISGSLFHVDFQHILKKEKIKATVPIHVTGDAPGVKKGGILDQHLHEVVVKCLPDDLPSHLEVNVSNLDLNGVIHLRDIKPPNVEFDLGLETGVVSVLIPKVEKVAAPAAAEAVPAEAAATDEETKEEGAKEKTAKEKDKELREKEEAKPAKEAGPKGK